MAVGELIDDEDGGGDLISTSNSGKDLWIRDLRFVIAGLRVVRISLSDS